MADDGMLLNFELPSDAFAPKLSFKGGNWKDRLIARKTAEWSRKKAVERAQAGSGAATADATTSTGESPQKRQRVAAAPSSTVAHGRGKASGSSHDFAPKGIISSLFTYNPISTADSKHGEEEEANDVAPSNAPMNDGLESFTQLGVSTTIANHLVKKMNIKAPTAVQRQAVQHLCSNVSDAFIQAQTGSGKTLAYLLPIVQRISDMSRQMKDSGQDFSRESGLFAIILAPTRELSKQIASVLDTLLSCYPFIICGSVIGGEKKKSEKARLRKGLNILVATPGRLSDHLVHTESIDVSRVRWLVLDEGDRLMELGFENDIQKLVSTLNLRATKTQSVIIPGLPPRRTTVLCSATIKADVDRLQNIALKDPVLLRVEPSEGGDISSEKAFSAPAQLRQSYVIVPAKQRLVTLAAVLKQTFRRKGSVMKAIVFLSCADSVDFHFEIFTHHKADKTDGSEEVKPTTPTKHNGKSSIPQGQTISEQRTHGHAPYLGTQQNKVDVYRLHGSLPQPIRTSTLKAFSQSELPAVLLCTDVASRGLDLPNIELVIEVDPPFSKDDHLHRIGRTARAGNDGRAMIFLQPGCEEGYVQILKDTQPRSLTGHDSDELLKKAFTEAKTESNAGMPWQDQATQWQLEVERWVVDDQKHREQAMRAFQSHVRAYATHVAAERGIFDMKQLHLGHLAKAFALRERPGDIRVPGLRPGKEENAKVAAKRKRDAGTKNTHAKDEAMLRTAPSTETPDAEHQARRKMNAKGRSLMGGASEFNLG
ncbi:hypothetical protein AMS68_004893 [Peltaster fructicola]|uniref:ATP-dependent RNA helicase n=1 Tax=Peltaster fructicola TaxID=286661 RepID=A0A6H0XXG8_9PEZI|nr:hypothetical protein AMS68_004893 [Peltaster fructicola]